MRSFVSHLEGALDGQRLPARTLQTVHEGRPIWVRYDLDAVKRAVRRDDLKDRPPTIWRYRELLPIESDDNIISLGETMTPLVRCPRIEHRFGMRDGGRIIIKDESRLPTGSFKSRGMAMAVSMAKELGVQRVAAPTAGNAGGALAAYAARARMQCVLFMPEDTPIVNQREAALLGAQCFLVNGLISDCGRLVREGAAAGMGWFDMSTLREPYRIEGKKTMGLELAEQLDWSLPDVILYPTGGGTGLIGMWKAFAELESIGWVKVTKPPRMFVCQSSGCAPIVRAFDQGERFAKPFENAHTIASGLRVPAAVGDFMILDAVRESGGRAMAADESRLIEWTRFASSAEGVSLCPETAACLDVLGRALDEGHIARNERIVIFNTGAGQKYVEAMPGGSAARLDCTRPIDWQAFACAQANGSTCAVARSG
jgi:threonine synthase